MDSMQINTNTIYGSDTDPVIGWYICQKCGRKTNILKMSSVAIERFCRHESKIFTHGVVEMFEMQFFPKIESEVK